MVVEPERGLDGETPFIFVDNDHVTGPAELLARCPALASPGAEVALARSVNHLTHGTLFAVIEDPSAFAAAYRARRASEPEVDYPPELGSNLALFELPDLDRLAPPSLQGRRLQFFVVNRALGFPYEVTFDLDDASSLPSYTPL